MAQAAIASGSRPIGSAMHSYRAWGWRLVCALTAIVTGNVSGQPQPPVASDEEQFGEGRFLDGGFPEDRDDAGVLGIVAESPNLSFEELCRSPDGRAVLEANLSSITMRDLTAQWEGLRFSHIATEATLGEYVHERMKLFCGAPHNEYLFRLALERPTTQGHCDDFRFKPPYYDVAATVREVEGLKRRYETEDSSWAGTTLAERDANLRKAISSTLAAIEANLGIAYLSMECAFERTSNCAGHTGQKKVCDRIYVVPPPFQSFVPDSLVAGRHVKESRILEPRLAYFRVGVTGHGENYGSIRLRSRFTPQSAAEKSSLDVDAIRSELVRRKLPTDRLPRVPPTPPKAPESAPKPKRPARFRVSCALEPSSPDVFNVAVTNTGASDGVFRMTIWHVDGFYSEPRREPAGTIDLTIGPGVTWMPESAFSSTRTIRWSVQLNLALDAPTQTLAQVSYTGRCSPE